MLSYVLLLRENRFSSHLLSLLFFFLLKLQRKHTDFHQKLHGRNVPGFNVTAVIDKDELQPFDL